MQFLDTLKTRAIALKSRLTAVWYASQDERIPVAPKIIIAIAVGYALSPIDLIPDFIPVLGYLDDLIILPALMGLAIKLIPDEVMADAEKKADSHPVCLKDNLYFAGIFILLWIAIIGAVIGSIIGALPGRHVQ